MILKDHVVSCLFTAGIPVVDVTASSVYKRYWSRFWFADTLIRVKGLYRVRFMSIINLIL